MRAGCFKQVTNHRYGEEAEHWIVIVAEYSVVAQQHVLGLAIDDLRRRSRRRQGCSLVWPDGRVGPIDRLPLIEGRASNER
jgi:hypothetical protein